jgi:hypothetical protein
MQTVVKPFEFKGTTVRAVIDENNNPHFCGKDAHRSELSSQLWCRVQGSDVSRDSTVNHRAYWQTQLCGMGSRSSWSHMPAHELWRANPGNGTRVCAGFDGSENDN